MKIKVILAAVLFLASCTFLLSLEETRELDLSGSGIDSLEIKCGAGFLHGRLRQLAGLDQLLIGKSHADNTTGFACFPGLMAANTIGDHILGLVNFDCMLGVNQLYVRSL